MKLPKRARIITIATVVLALPVALYLVVSTIVLGVGISMYSIRGIEFALCAFTFAGVLQTIWLWYRSRATLATIA